MIEDQARLEAGDGQRALLEMLGEASTVRSLSPPMRSWKRCSASRECHPSGSSDSGSSATILYP